MRRFAYPKETLTMIDDKTLPYHLKPIKPKPLEVEEQAQVNLRLNNKMMKRLQASFAKQEEDSLEALHDHLRTAMMLELSTIPPYLCALYSIMEGDTTQPDYSQVFGDNADVALTIRSVMMEEMLHFTLAGNILLATGGTPAINTGDYVPEYPTALPDSAGLFQVHLSKMDRDAISTFLRIERPTPEDAEPKFEGYNTIGQFYHAIERMMTRMELAHQSQGKTIFTGDPARQIDAKYYYGGGGEIVAVTNLEEAKAAIEVILEQGEGSEMSIYDTDHSEFGQIRELAHFFKFNEIFEERRYASCQVNPKSAPDGPELRVKYDQVYNMAKDPKTVDYPTQALKRASHAFNLMYRQLLDDLQAAFMGEPERLIQAVAYMYKLKYHAVALMRNPIPGKRVNAGPTFEFLSDQEVAKIKQEFGL